MFSFNTALNVQSIVCKPYPKKALSLDSKPYSM